MFQVGGSSDRALGDGRTVWITGASRGIGEALTYAFAAYGDRLLLTARNEQQLEKVAARARELGANEVLTASGTVNRDADVARAASLIRSHWGQLHILVNNAGISPILATMPKMKDEKWHQVIDTNLNGVFRCCKAVSPLMVGGTGSIINMSSIHAVEGMAGLSAYAASKGGVEALTRSLALELAPRGVRVNAVAPGYFETDMTTGVRENVGLRDYILTRIPLGRFGTVDELVGAVTFLASDAASYVTGSTLFVDGGWRAG